MTAAERYAALSRQEFFSTRTAASLSGSIEAIRDILRHREMLGLLVRRDLKARYKDSALGFLWSLIRPLTQLLIYYVVLGKFLSAERAIPDFAIYVFTGLTAYGLFGEIVSGATGSILANAGLVKKVYLPREVFPLASVGSALFNFLMQLGILLIATIIGLRFPAHVEILYLIPGLLNLLVWGLAIGLLLAALNVYLRDIGYLVEVFLLLALWASPVVYAWHQVRGRIADLAGGLVLELYTDNPITLGVLAFHRAFWISGPETEYPTWLELRLVVSIAVGVLAVIGAQRVFARLQGNFAQEL